jgi:hypothetical protein
MVEICDRSPCDSLLNELGSTIFGSPEGDGFYMVVIREAKEVERDIRYCPFCGTRLEGVPSVIVEKFTKPRRRKRVVKPAS